MTTTDHDISTCMACRQAMKLDAERLVAVEELIKEVDEVRRMAPFPRVKVLLRRVEDRLREIV